MFKDKDLRKGILASVLASFIFLIFIQPISNFVWANIVKLSTNTYTDYIDSIYANAAFGKRNWVDLITLNYWLSFIFGLLFFMLYVLRDKLKEINKKAKELDMSKEEMENYLHNEHLSLLKKVAFIKKHSYKVTIFTYITQVVVFFLLAHTLFTAYIDLELNSSFSQRCTVLAPYIDDQTQKILQSKWALMKSRKDYEVVNQYLKDIAKSKNVVLPESLLK